MFSNVGRRLVLLLPLLAWLLAGCASTDNASLYDKPGVDAGTDSVARLHIGDSVVIAFEGQSEFQIAPHEEIIKEDKSITLPDIGGIEAAGRTPGELQTAIQSAYVPKYYKRLVVTVKTGERVFYVRGAIKAPGRQIYTGPITLTKAITSAGDFDEAANRKNVVLTRANGKRYLVNCNSILDGKKPDPDVYPGDQIEVKQKSF